MKRKIVLCVAAAIASIVGLSSCSKDENQAPKINGAVLSSDNKTITVTFSEGVYKNADKTGNLDASSLTVTAPAEIEFTYTVEHTAGNATAVVNLVITSVVQGTEKFTVKPASASAIYDNEGEPMGTGTTIETNVASKDLGIMGNWLSEGANVAPLLVTYFNVLKVEAEFKTDYTYKVNQFNIGNTTTTPDLIFTGTYEIEKSTTDNIWTITCNQELPYAATASGIFEVKTNPEVMWYEVVQTTGTQNVPPTPQAGFGSSNGGSLGTINIQKFVRVL